MLTFMFALATHVHTFFLVFIFIILVWGYVCLPPASRDLGHCFFGPNSCARRRTSVDVSLEGSMPARRAAIFVIARRASRARDVCAPNVWGAGLKFIHEPLRICIWIRELLLQHARFVNILFDIRARDASTRRARRSRARDHQI